MSPLGSRRSPILLLPVLLAVALGACAGGGERAEESVEGERGSAGESAFAAEVRRPAPEPGPRAVSRILLVALDGGTWLVADPLLEAGKLPNLAAVAARGVRADLRTLEPTVSPAIWTTIATGVLPDRHGILGFDGVPGQTMTTLPNSRMRRVKAFWEILRDAGFTSGTIGWWATWPADSLGEGSYLVSDRVPYTRMEAAVRRATLTPEDVWPPELLDDVAPLVEKPNDLDPAVARRFLGFDEEMTERFLLRADYRMGDFLPEFKFVYQSDRSTLKMALELLERRRVDLASVYFTGIDTVSHLYWHFTYPEGFASADIRPEDIERFGSVIPLYYELIDGYLGRLIEAAGEEATIVVVSDHGFGGTGNLPWSGGHGRLTPGAPIAPAGMLVMAGPGIRSDGGRLERAHVLDVAPTLLYLLGLPAGEDMLGRVLVEAMAPGSPEPLAQIESWERVGRQREPGAVPVEPAGDAERMERLRALGYIQ